MPTDSGAPYGTALTTSNQWFDGAVQFRNGGSVTQAAGNTATFNGTLTVNGQSTVGGANSNDLTQTLVPSAYGLIDWNFPYVWATGTAGAVTTAGLLYLTKVPLAGGTKVTNLWFKIATAAATPTTAENFGGIYSASGALVATTADLTTVIGTNTGPIQGALTTPYTVPAAGNYYIGFFFNAATQPVLSTYVGFTAITTSAQNFGSATTGNTTAMPASITMSSNTATNAWVYWAGVN